MKQSTRKDKKFSSQPFKLDFSIVEIHNRILVLLHVITGQLKNKDKNNMIIKMVGDNIPISQQINSKRQ